MSAAVLHQACDRALAQASPKAAAALPTLHPHWVLATTILASSLAFIDGSVVNVGLPAIGRSLDVSGGGLSWVVNGYLLPLSALLLIGGAAGDVFGRARLLISGVTLFALASVLCALAPNLTILIAGRVLQGTGAALLMPNSLAILGASFSGEAQGRAIGSWAAVGAAAGAVGPLLGGYLIDVIGWRTIFLINLPLAGAAIVLCARYVREQRTARPARLDFAGATLAAAALTLLTWALTATSAAQHLTLAGAAGLTLGAGLLALFVWLERHRGEHAMLPLRLFASRRFVGLTVLTLLLYGALSVLLVLVPYLLIEASGYSATAAGAALLPLPLIIALTSSRLGQLAVKVGPRLPLTIGPLLVGCGFLLALRVVERGSYFATTLPAMLVVSLGMAGAVAPLTTAVLASVEPAHVGVASGFNSAVARIGGLVATAFASAVLAAHGAALRSSFRAAAVIGAVACVAAGASAYLSLNERG